MYWIKSTCDKTDFIKDHSTNVESGSSAIKYVRL